MYKGGGGGGGGGGKGGEYPFTKIMLVICSMSRFPIVTFPCEVHDDGIHPWV